MASELTWILGSVILVSLLSFVGVFTLSMKKKSLENFLFVIVSFAAGIMLGAAFLDLLPEAIEKAGVEILPWTLLAIISFFFIEQFLYWYHCHGGECDTHKPKKGNQHIAPVGLLNIFGDGVHNFIDGMIIAATYLVSIPLGITATIAVILHEIPQEIGDFGILMHAGFTRAKALMFNFLSAITAIVGAMVAFYFANAVEGFLPAMTAFAAGGFIYIASADLLPELHKETKMTKGGIQLFFFVLGIALIWILGKVL